MSLDAARKPLWRELQLAASTLVSTPGSILQQPGKKSENSRAIAGNAPSLAFLRLKVLYKIVPSISIPPGGGRHEAAGSRSERALDFLARRVYQHSAGYLRERYRSHLPG